MKRFLLFAAAAIVAIATNAQVADVDDEFEESGIVDRRTSAVHLGVRVGANISTMSKYEMVDLGQKSGFGFEGGLVLSARFGKRTLSSDAGTGMFGVQIEPSFVQRTIGTGYENIKLGYFEIPILLKIFVTPNVNIEVGPNIAGTLSRSPDFIDAVGTRFATGDIKGFDIKACVGVSYELKEGLYASLRYNLGTSNLAGNFPCKVSGASLTIGYKFNIFKF